jgi:hypothetical protein
VKWSTPSRCWETSHKCTQYFSPYPRVVSGAGLCCLHALKCAWWFKEQDGSGSCARGRGGAVLLSTLQEHGWLMTVSRVLVFHCRDVENNFRAFNEHTQKYSSIKLDTKLEDTVEYVVDIEPSLVKCYTCACHCNFSGSDAVMCKPCCWFGISAGCNGFLCRCHLELLQ